MVKIKLYRTLLLVSLMFTITLFLVGVVSAMDWDNIKEFTKTKDMKYGRIDIYNSFIIPGIVKGDKLESVELIDNSDFCLINCKAEKEIIIYQKGRLIDSVKFKVLRNGDWEDTKVNYEFYLRTEHKGKEVDVYTNVCEENGLAINGSINYVCKNKKTGTKTEYQDKWETFDITKEVPAGTYYIKLEGIKGKMDTVDWIITSQGKELTEWATWTGTLNSNLLAYYTFNETTGAIGYDSLGIRNITDLSTGRVGGKIGNAYNSSGEANKLGNTTIMMGSIGTSFSINFWINDSKPTTTEYFLGAGGRGSTITNISGFYASKQGGQINLNLYGTTLGTVSFSYLNLSQNAWTMITYVFTNGSQGAYVNGTLIASGAGNYNSFNASNLLLFNDGADANILSNGQMDEVGIWNRALTQEEITNLWNSGSGITYGGGGVSSTQLTPADYVNTTSPVMFSCNVSVAIDNLKNSTLWVINSSNYVYKKTNTTLTGTSAIVNWTVALNDSNYKWSCDSWSDTDFVVNSGNRSLTVDSTSPSITIFYPTGTLDYVYNNENLTFNFSIYDANVNTCWYEYNGVNSTIPCNLNNTLIISTNKTLTLWANDSAGNTQNYTEILGYRIFEDNVTYSNPVVEGELTQINSSFDLSESPTSIVLVYNGTSYIPSVTAVGNTYYLSSTIVSPSVSSDINISFYYSFVISGNTITTNPRNQTVTNVGLTATCGGGTFPLLNLYNYDEDLLTAINGTVEYKIALINNGLQITSANGSSTGTNISVCSTQNLSNSLATFSLELRYWSTVANNSLDTFYETYNIQDSPGATAPLNVNLYYLNLSKGTEFKINYLDFNYLTHPGAIIQIQRQYIPDDSYRIVEIPKISDNGQAVAALSTNNIRYKFIVINSGIILDTFNDVFPVCQNVILGTCEINLRGKQTPESTTTGDFTYTIEKTNSSIILTYIIPSGTPRSLTFQANQNSRFLDNVSVCNTTIFASGGTISCPYNQTLGDSVVDLQIAVSGQNTLYGSIQIAEDLSGFFLTNNYFIAFILLLSIGLMFISSGVMITIGAVVGILYLGLIFLIKGVGLTTIATSLAWLIVAAVAIVYFIAKKEERT